MVFPIKRQPLYMPMLGSFGGGSTRAFGMTVGGGSSAINISSSDTPNFASPQFTRTSSGSWTKPAGLDDNTIVHVLLVGSGGGGNSTYYDGNSSWKFSGGGGSALLFITTAGIADGLSCSIAAGSGPSGSWRSRYATANTISIGGNSYTTNWNNSAPNRPYYSIGDGQTLFTCTSGFTNQFYTIPTQSETTTLAMTDGSTSKTTVYASGNDTNGLSTQGGTGLTDRILGAGNGYATYGGTGWEASQYSGNGASGIANGTAPGGGASYSRTGAAGNLRVYY